MLEKIGLPPKPSLRGNQWVIDASNCQACSSQFTFLNRKVIHFTLPFFLYISFFFDLIAFLIYDLGTLKHEIQLDILHHCRRCGGIFCNSCTQQRMVLRGQGDSPVRICEPCKKLEEAARFELRYGHKTRAAKGGSKLALKEDEVLDQILGNEDKVSPTQKTLSSASCSNIPDITEVESASTPEELREQAVLEKNKYKTLKAEGKSEEALRAFKRGKELERQAGTLEISLRKSRKKALSSTSLDNTQNIKDEFKSSSGKSNLSVQKSKAKDDISSELKELGWSDMDIHETEKKAANLSLEGELSSLLREVSQKPNKEKGTAINSKMSQVTVHKKKALELKRAGNLVEAKEELKKAKILEKKIEEEELLGEADESDDELSSLIRSMDSDEQDDLSTRYKSDHLDFNFDNLVGMADDLGDGNFEVTDKDLDDPEMASALKSLGWDEEDNDASSNNESLLTEIQSLKRKALTQKRAGNTVEAMSLLKKAKLLEMELESSDSKGSVEEPLFSTRANIEKTSPPKSKLTIQKELLSLKKKALTLRREGKLDESEEELKKAKVLEQQLEDMNKAPTITQSSTANTNNPGDGDEEEVTDQDMHDPSYLSLLKNLGWEDEDKSKVPSTTVSKENERASKQHNFETGTSRKSKSEIQRELLVLKRKALTLRRQGEAEEADEVLKMAALLEAQLQEYEEPTQREREVSTGNSKANASSIDVPIRIEDLRNQDTVTLEKPEIIVQEKETKPTQREREVSTGNSKANASSIGVPIRIEDLRNQDTVTLEKPEIIVQKKETQPSSGSLQQEILAHKRKALALKREGKLAEAKEELRQAKLLETNTTSSDVPDVSNVSPVEKKEAIASPSSAPKPLSSRERFKLQQESLGHKRQALKLRREGKTAEADAEFELAKAIESRLEESDSSKSAAETVDDVSIEDFLDPQLLSALQSIGLEDVRTQTPVTERQEPTKSEKDNNENADMERQQLAEQIKLEKVKAVNLKRSGKQAEALDALRRAKLYEKKLLALTTST
ncbi:hypothetical protein ACJIZ3_017185 [Penstemon smallii]|uniref:FYVE-type domain-containing protein n=1 Tax=Penstemon smallii TaxID=265156 RepID=A0ABD3SV75_9LAMI